MINTELRKKEKKKEKKEKTETCCGVVLWKVKGMISGRNYFGSAWHLNSARL